MKAWNLVPVLRLLLPFIGGIILQLFFPVESTIWFAVLITGILASFIPLLIKNPVQKWKFRWWSGVCICILFFSLGALRSFIEKDSNQPDHFQYQNGELYMASLNEPFVEKPKSYKSVVNVIAVKKNGEWKNTSGKLLVYFSKQEFDSTLSYGDCFLFASPPQEIQQPQNPEEFNYKRFLSFHNVFQQVYLPSGKWTRIDDNVGNPVLRASYHLRTRLINILRAMLPEHREFAVASALVVGYDDELDPELINAYSSSGALHVLSVSGMHVGAIFIVLTWMLNWMKRWKWGIVMRFILLLTFLWWYALITGFSPSVLRSAAMLSIVIIGQWLKSNSGIMNTLLVSMFVLLVYNPFMITEVGFQLSYLAVFGIVYLHPKLFQQIIMPNWFLHQVWMITSVSICAQLMTFPLGLLYFHQFPNLFVVSNLIIIPLTTGIIYACILLMLVSSLQFIGVLISKICAFAIWFVNQTVLLVDQLPYAVTNGVSITVFETWLIYALILFGLFFLMQKRVVMLQGFLGVAITLCIFNIHESIRINNQKRIVVFNVNNHSAIDLINGRENVFISDTVMNQDKNALRFHIRQHWWKNGLYATTMSSMTNQKTVERNAINYFCDNRYLLFENQKWIRIDSAYASKLKQTNEPFFPFKADVLLLSENARITLKRLKKFVSPSKIIIDSSNKRYIADKWIKEAEELKMDCYSVLHKGAYVHELNP